MISMSAIERQALNEKLSAIPKGHKPEINKEFMKQGGYALRNDEQDTHGMVLVTEESSEATFRFMHKIFGENIFFTR